MPATPISRPTPRRAVGRPNKEGIAPWHPAGALTTDEILGNDSLRLLRDMNPGNIPHLEEIGIDPAVLAFTVALCVATGMLFGAIPALQASKADLNETLKEGGHTSFSSSGQNRLRGLLVILETALALILLIGAGLMIKSFRSLMQAPMGFNPHEMVTTRITPTLLGHSVQEMPLLYEHMLERISSPARR